jgi:hypothetical protein
LAHDASAVGPGFRGGAINRLPVHFEPRENGFLARTNRGTCLLTESRALRRLRLK